MVKLRKSRSLLGLLGIALMGSAIFSVPSAQAAGLLIADGGFGGVLEIKEQDIKVTINNGVAVTDIEQVFVNTEDRIVEALYTFPVPQGASVANFSMWIQGQEMIGEVVEKQRAREIYESYKQTRVDPGLLEQVDYKRFEMRIFPIAARAEQRVKITYYQELDFDHDWATYVYPLATVTQPNLAQRTTGKFALTLDVTSEIPITKLESPSHPEQFVVVPHSPQYYQASLETSGGDLSRDFVLAFKSERPRTGLDIIASKQAGEDGYFLLTLTAGQELAEINRGMDFVFLLDISGSMSHEGKLRLSRNSLLSFIEGLSPENRFEVITFNVAAQTLFNQLGEVNEQSLREAREFLESQQARGGTVLQPAINAAYRYHDSDRTLNVVILSDGVTEHGEHRQLLESIRRRPPGTHVFCIGVGNEVNRPLLAQLAEESGGLAAFLSQEDSFQRQAQAFHRKLLRPAMSDIQITFQGGDVYDIQPQRLPNLYHGAPLRMYGRFRQAGQVQVTVSGEILGSPLKQTVEVKLPETDANNPEIERMWAWHRVEQLMSEDRRNGTDRNQDEIVRLCEGYSIVSQYASFIVLENDAEYQRWKIKRQNATRVQRDRRAQQAVRQELETLRQQAAAKLGPDADANRMAGNKSADVLAMADSSPAAVPSDDGGPASNRASRGRDLIVPNSSGGGSGSRGGGAIDPLSGAMALVLAGWALTANRRQRRRHGESLPLDRE